MHAAGALPGACPVRGQPAVYGTARQRRPRPPRVCRSRDEIRRAGPRKPGGEWYFVPAIAPWASRGVIRQWRRRVSIGEALATARSQAGLTITQVSQRTRIRETIIRGIERDDFSACGADFYARGHIRAIARAAGADPEPLVAEYDSSHGTPPASAAAGAPGPAAPL